MSEREQREQPGADEVIPDGGGPPEEDVQGEQGEADWSTEPLSDAGLSPEAQKRLRLKR